MKRVLLAVAVVVVAIVVYLMTRHHGSADSAVSARGSSATTGGGAPATSGNAPTVTPAPSLPDNGGSPRLPDRGSASEYVVGDVRVRDHRGGSNAPLDVPPNVHPPGQRQIPSSLTSAMAQRVRGVLAECTKDLSPEARGTHARLEGQIVVTIKDHTMSVASATMQLRDMPAEALDATRQCVEQKAVGLATPAPDQDDLDKYSIGVTFAVR